MRRTVAGLLPMLIAGGIAAAGASPVDRVPLLELEVRALAAEPDAGVQRVAVRPGRPQRLRFETDWPDVGRVGVELDADAEPVGDSGVLELLLQARLRLPGGRTVENARRAVVDQRATILFEVYRRGERPFTLAVGATVSETWEVSKTPSFGPRVRFDVEVLRVEGNARTSLERNMLNTFVDHAVRYEFRREGPSDEALTLSLTPVRLVEDLIEIKISVAGRLPDEEGTTVIARDQNLVVNRGTTSPVVVTVGDPPRGYLFEVTPRF